MGTVHAKAAGPGGDSVGDAGAGSLFEFEEPIDVEEAPLHKPSIKLNGVRARVDRVHVDGLSRTKDDIIRSTVDQLFHAADFEDVILRAHKVRRDLDALGCFKEIGVFIDVSGGPGATPEGLEVTFRVKELSRVVGGVNTTVGENEGNLVVGMKLPNVAGRGERLAAEYSMGYRSTSNFSLVGSKPLPGRPLAPVLGATLYQQAHEAPASGYRCVERGAVAEVALKAGGNTRHQLQWEGLVRDTSVLGKAAAFEVRAAAGPQLKSLVRHIVTVEARDAQVFPTRGHLVRFTSEVCGLGGGVAHVRTELRAQKALEILPRVTLVVGGWGAALHDVCGSTLPDRVFVGGATSLRGFAERGAGPHAERCATGGELGWAAGAQVLVPLPGAREGGALASLARAHLFVNAGWVGGAGAGWEAVRGARVSAGGGVAVRVGGAARLELNYAVPVRALPGDVTAPGLQFGVGAHFL